MINRISDIKVGSEYFICILKGCEKIRKVNVLGVINDNEFSERRTEIYVDTFKGKKWVSKNLYYLKEIGIGETKGEAIKNFGVFDYEENPCFSSSLAEVDKNRHF